MKDTEEKKNKSTELFAELESLSSDLKERKERLILALSEADKKKTDIEHYIEFYTFNASKGYKVAKMLQDCLQERRDIKDEIEMIDNILRMNIGFIGKGKGSLVLEVSKNKKYTPRVLKELFQD